MDKVMNLRSYPDNLIRNYSNICLYNAIKEKYVPALKGRNFYSREPFLEENHALPEDLQRMLVCQDGDLNKSMRIYVGDDIAEAICSINIRPSCLKLMATLDNYVLHVIYTNGGLPDGDSLKALTSVHLEYTFHEDFKTFDGYFCDDVTKCLKLPDYSIVTKVGNSIDEISSFLRITYHDDPKKVSSLDLKIIAGAKKNIDQIIEFANFCYSDKLDMFHVNTSLLDAILHRIFPTAMHYLKYRISEIVSIAQRDFHLYFKLTSLNWSNRNENDILFAKYMLNSYTINETRPINDNKEYTESDMLNAMNMLVAKHHYLIPNENYVYSEECLLFLWERYYKKNLKPKKAQTFKLGDSALNNLVKFYCADPVTYKRVFELFPQVRFCVALTDMNRRMDLLREMKLGLEINVEITLKDVAIYNRMASTIADVQWRLFLSGGTLDNPNYEVGGDIIQRKTGGESPTSMIDKMNYLDTVDYSQQLSFFAVMEEIQRSFVTAN